MITRSNHLFWLILALACGRAGAQSVVPATAQPQPPNASASTDARLDAMSRLLAATQDQLETTQGQLNALRAELDQLRSQRQPAQAVSASQESSPAASTSTSLTAQVAQQRDEQEILEAEIKQHDQTKLESLSKYPVRVYGLVLFNTFSNAGVVDNPDLPSVAITRTPGQSHGSVGGSLRQTLLGINANGPNIFGARSSADLSIDFFGDPTYNYYGSSNGNVRLRRGNVALAWGVDPVSETAHSEIVAGVDGPLISPLSPTSFATVANPALAWSGNLWTWAPEIQARHTVALPGANLQFEGGLWDPPAVSSTGIDSSRVLSAGELARRPGFLGRTSIHGGSLDHPLAFGIGGFTERQTVYGQQVRLWAITSDWQLPLSHRFQLDGELYRGKGLGGLGGGEYKDTLTGVDAATGLERTIGLNAVGGWAQLKFHATRTAEANLIYGQDGAFSSDFRQLDLAASTYTLERSARNQSLVTNFIYRPKTYILLSPEYRRIASWQLTGPVATANIFTLSLGYQF